MGRGTRAAYPFLFSQPLRPLLQTLERKTPWASSQCPIPCPTHLPYTPPAMPLPTLSPPPRPIFMPHVEPAFLVPRVRPEPGIQPPYIMLCVSQTEPVPGPQYHSLSGLCQGWPPSPTWCPSQPGTWGHLPLTTTRVPRPSLHL